MSGRAAVVAIAVAALALGCGGPDPGRPAPPPSGIAGRTVVDAGCPEIPVREDCSWRPLAAHVVVVRVAAGDEQVVAEVDSGADGAFSVGVPSGSYLLRARNRTGAPMPSAFAVPVTVHDGRFETVEIRFDSGVR